MRATLHLLCLGLIVVALPAATPAQTPEQRKELLDLKRELSQVSSLVRKKEFEQAKQAYDDADAKLGTIAEAIGVSKSDRKLMGIDKTIEKGQETLEIAWARAEGRPPKIGVSFSEVIAPIIQDNCVSCHSGATPASQLDLSTFAGWKRGGRTGAVIAPGSANRSKLALRLIAQDDRQRMPRNAAALSQDDIQTIAKWIDQGARYDSDSDSTSLADLGKPGGGAMASSVVIPKPTGNETVSFTRDIAPFMSNLCVRCHNSNRQSGGLSLETFHDMMKGGDSGRVVLPGNVEGSRLFRLTGGLENPRMPADNQARITRDNYNDLKTWFEEGNTFDGTDPKTPLRQFALAATETPASQFASMSKEEFNTHRRSRTEQQFKKAVPNDPANYYETDEFLLYGNASQDRLKEVEGWAQEHLQTLKQTFGGGSGQTWKGRLAIFVFSDRFGYDEFNQGNNGRRAPKEMFGHSLVSPTYEDAYVCLQDVGDEATNEVGGLQVSLMEHLTAAFLQREGATIPDWAVRGTGLAMAGTAIRGNAYLRDLDAIAADALKTVLNPADIFADGQFSPALTGAVGYSLVKYMIENGGMQKFGQFVQQLRQGQSSAQAVRGVYNADLEALGRGFAGSISGRRR
ncbi:MAG: hypothetical protein KDA75_07660 [Planctomycetaceae bacterium]|nr:hypothetical protein [Planctomycetaceae bacterium]